MIVEKMVVGPLSTNCYLVACENGKEAMIIDPGDEAEVILKRVKELGLDIILIVLTHGHADHVAALKGVKEATTAEVAIHEADAGSLNSAHLKMLLFIHGRRQGTPGSDRALRDGECIEVGNLNFTVLHTPGHTKGGICLYGEGVLFSGDTLFNYGIGRADLPGSSPVELMESIHGKLLPLPDEVVVYPGHGPATTIGAERRGNPFLQNRFSP